MMADDGEVGVEEEIMEELMTVQWTQHHGKDHADLTGSMSTK